uniref:Retroelement n=1 Tax=Oryza sativa subsp. japonica TaxID=39947 RepID=Q94HP1_ORYSJ|nr:Putative retroelement [Oryza sativa Japonica Group]
MVFTLPAEFGIDQTDVDEVEEESIKPEQAVFEKPEGTENRHLKPLYINGYVNGKPMSKMMVDGGAAINLMPYAMFRKLGRNAEDLIKTNMVLKDFGGNPSETKGVLNVELTVGSKTIPTTFFVIDGKGSYSLFLEGLGFMPIVAFLQLCINWQGDKIEIVPADRSVNVASADLALWEMDGLDCLSRKMENPSYYFEGVVEGSNVYTKDTVDDLDDNRSIVEHRLPIKLRVRPHQQPPRRCKADMLEPVKAEIKRLYDAGFIRPCRYAEWVSSIVPVIKKKGKVRTFGLKSAGATYQRAMNYIYHDLIGWLVEVYIDDVVVKSKEIEDHIADLRKVFERTRKYNLKMNPTKCAFGVSAGQFLGFLVHERGIEVTQRSVNAIKKIQPPENKTELQEMIGKITFVRRLRHYLLSNECTVICKADVVKYMLSALILKGRVGKYIFSLTEFDLRYESPKAIKGQAIADFIVEHRDDSIGSVEILPWTLFFDGSVCTHGCGIGLVIISPRGACFEFAYTIKPYATNNQAEYEAVLKGLELLKEVEADAIEIMGDSLIVISQLAGEYECKNDTLMAKVAIGEVHVGICGTHQSAHKMKWLLRRAGYYKGCQDCQKFGAIQRAPASAMNPIIKPWPFRGWGIDMIGMINPPLSKGHKFILVATDYFTKWVEAIALKKVDSGDATQFVQEYIIYRFGIPRTITTDQGSIFVSDEFVQFADSMGIKLLNSSPYYAQDNGQAEASNKSLIKLIKRKISDYPRQWHTRLAEALWSYRMACHGSI